MIYFLNVPLKKKKIPFSSENVNDVNEIKNKCYKEKRKKINQRNNFIICIKIITQLHKIHVENCLKHCTIKRNNFCTKNEVI